MNQLPYHYFSLINQKGLINKKLLRRANLRNRLSIFSRFTVLSVVMVIFLFQGCQQGMYEIHTYGKIGEPEKRKEDTILKCFSSGDFRKIARKTYQEEWGRMKTSIYVVEGVVNEDLCIGIFNFERVGKFGEFAASFYVLKFENQVYIGYTLSSEKRLKVIAEFEAEYSPFFSAEDLRIIRERFSTAEEPLIIDERFKYTSPLDRL